MSLFGANGKPAITSEAESIKNLIDEASAALRQASIFSRKSHEQWRFAGQVFNNAKNKCGFGKWRETADKAKLDERKVQLAIRIYANWEELTAHPDYSPDLGIGELKTILVSIRERKCGNETSQVGNITPFQKKESGDSIEDIQGRIRQNMREFAQENADLIREIANLSTTEARRACAEEMIRGHRELRDEANFQGSDREACNIGFLVTWENDNITKALTNEEKGRFQLFRHELCKACHELDPETGLDFIEWLTPPPFNHLLHILNRQWIYKDEPATPGQEERAYLKAYKEGRDAGSQLQAAFDRGGVQAVQELMPKLPVGWPGVDDSVADEMMLLARCPLPKSGDIETVKKQMAGLVKALNSLAA
jgi:hypothetical protein